MEIVDGFSFVEALLCTISEHLNLTNYHVVVAIAVSESPLFKHLIRDGLVSSIEEDLAAVFRACNQHAFDEWRLFVICPVAALSVVILEAGSVQIDLLVRIREKHLERDEQADADLDRVEMLFFGDFQNFF